MDRIQYVITGSIVGGGIALLWTLIEMLKKGRKGEFNQSKLSGTSLHDAVASGDLERIKVELQDISNLNATNIYGFTPLNVAAWQGYSRVVKLLIDAGADIEAKDNAGATVLHHVFLGYDERINSLSNEKDSLGELVEIVTYLINKGVDVNAISPMDTFVLQGAAFLGSTALIKVLVENGAKLNACGENGITPLAIAICQNNTEVVKVLLDYNAELKVSNESGAENILDFAKTNGANEQILEILKRKTKS